MKWVERIRRYFSDSRVVSVTAHAENGIASVTIVNGRTVQVEARHCSRPDCPFSRDKQEAK